VKKLGSEQFYYSLVPDILEEEEAAAEGLDIVDEEWLVALLLDFFELLS